MKRRTSHGCSNSLVPLLLLAASVLAGLSGASLAGAKDLRSSQTLTAKIALVPSRVPAGAAVSGKLVLDNRTSVPKVVLRGCMVNGLYAVALRAADGYMQDPAFTLVACSHRQSLVAKPGTTVFRFKIRATYTACSESPNHHWPRRSKNWLPLCLKDSSGKRDVAPPLPAGKYTAVFVPNGTWKGPDVRTATLVVTKSG